MPFFVRHFDVIVLGYESYIAVSLIGFPLPPRPSWDGEKTGNEQFSMLISGVILLVDGRTVAKRRKVF